MPTRFLIIAAVAVLILAGALGAILISKGTTDAGGKALIGGPFTLVDQSGKPVTEKDFEGRFMLAYFGYTFCPDFCPLGLSTITEALELLEEAQAERITPVFFSVDPKRDNGRTSRRLRPEFPPAHDGSDRHWTNRSPPPPKPIASTTISPSTKAMTTPSITPPSST